ncbi:putative mitochondrial chaperone bcs1 [Fulvia fulva]|uniref:Mitochondrial chaperone bcs1 n=1 Tax=Passalora fulva TaxID=5499 RepID=A0A9Q8P8T5_PASFU|nr:putative mitochondrial chaperone bcs1 [Fulvia fulva]KAK4624072.1 putative mitochondrial chaperone bcs1 [Fulvia fulva]KAK4625372.1 putative mitochondrial chaperone bcs1 [Fulvia fulva]UJO17565.1 putative mitochondrial chaperone bcs1 [Fulvia fulva]WPV14702.1 putative mitochondrial chaperone bcs1 [Fulvia fulva]WPV30178.1 putative mitochondrial chaperone bcs1 [Fulvia fulva]
MSAPQIDTRWQQMAGSLVAIAAGIRADSSILDLSPEGIFRNAITLLQQRHSRLAIFLGTTIPLAVLAYAIYDKLGAVFRAFQSLRQLKTFFSPSVTIQFSHPMRFVVLAWLANNSKASPKSMALQTSGSLYEHTSPRNTLEYISHMDETSLRFNGRTFYVTRGSGPVYEEEKLVRPAKDMKISYTSFWGTNNITPIKEFLAMVHSNSTKSKETLFHRVDQDGMGWTQPVGKVPRSMNSIAMATQTKEDLVKDVKSYLSEESKAWYASVGIPHRRGYLFYGPPGCGKSSVASALAGDFKLQVFSIAVSNPALTDDALEALFAQLPDRSLVLLEDVDSAGIERSTPDAKGKSDKKSDPALVCPGRIDMPVLFANANHEIMQQMFAKIFADLPGDSTISSQYDIPKLSQAFAASIPEDKLTPAELQNFLLMHRASPVNAVEKAKAWAETLIETKAQGRNVSHFTGQIGETRPSPTQAAPTTTNTAMAPPAMPEPALSISAMKNGFAMAPGTPTQISPSNTTLVKATQPPTVDEHNPDDDHSSDDESSDDDEENQSPEELKMEIKDLKARLARVKRPLTDYGSTHGGRSLFGRDCMPAPTQQAFHRF